MLEKEAPSKVTIRRRNTLDNIIFNEMCDKADRDYENETNQDITKEGNRKCKRSLKLLRGNERDLKLDMEAVYNYAERSDHYQASTPNHMKVWNEHLLRTYSSSRISNSFFLATIQTRTNWKYLQIETRNRFRSLRSKPVDIEEKSVQPEVNEQTLHSDSTESVVQSPGALSFKEREIFHDTFSFLIKLVSIHFIINIIHKDLL